MLRNFELPIDAQCIYNNSIGDFTAAYQAVGTIRITGLSFVPAVNQIAKIIRLSFATPNYFPTKLELGTGFSISAGVGYFDIVLNGVTTLASTDVYDVYIVGSKKSYNQSSDTNYVTIANSNTSIPPVELINTTNVAATTTYYPSSYGFQIGKKAKLRMWDYCAGGVTNYLEVSPDSAFATPIAIIGTDINTATAAASWADSAGKAIDFAGIDQCYFRVKSVTADNTNTVKIIVDITNETLV